MLKHFSVYTRGILQIQLKVNWFSLNCSFKIKKYKSVSTLILFANYLSVLSLSPWQKGGHASRNTKLQLGKRLACSVIPQDSHSSRTFYNLLDACIIIFCHCCLYTPRFCFFCSIHISINLMHVCPSGREIPPLWLRLRFLTFEFPCYNVFSLLLWEVFPFLELGV